MRLFVALTLPDPALDAIADWQERLPAGRPVPEDNLHLTLAFLGDTSPETAQAVHDALDTLRGPHITLTLTGAQVFGGRHGQAVALGAEGGLALTELHDRLRARLRSVDVAPDRRRFRPHVTVARLSGKGNAAPLISALAPARLGPFCCTGFALVSSVLHRDGAMHDVLADYPLGN